MTQADQLKELIQEIDDVHPGGDVDFSKLDKNVLPTFETAENGFQCHFTIKALDILRKLGNAMYRASGQDALLKFDEYYSILKQSIAECYSRRTFDLNDSKFSDDDRLDEFKKVVDLKIALLRIEFTHYFPAWTLGVEVDGQPYRIGPVTFLTRNDWIDTIQLPTRAVEASSSNWKLDLVSLLRGGNGTGIDSQLFEAIRHCPSILKVSISGSEYQLSKKRGRWACKAALDSLALLFPDAKLHSQFGLYEEAAPPVTIHTLTETDQNLWWPGSKLNVRGWRGDPSVPTGITLHGQHLISACGLAITAVLDPSSHGSPLLAQRWTTALGWFGDGCREPNDAVAVAKLATSLDVLACGGKSAGILKMLEHLYGVPAKTIIVPDTGATLEDVVREIYNYGRSQILHGTHVDPMKPFDTLRSHATTLARIALRETVLGWSRYSGPDVKDVFRTIPRWQQPS